jgi:hypothetical protein
VYPILHTELESRERPRRSCEICRRPATLTVSHSYTIAEGSLRSASLFFCARHAREAPVMRA